MLSFKEKQEIKQQKIIKKDIRRELHRQRKERELKTRIEKGEIINDPLMDNDNPFETFFMEAQKMGDNIEIIKLKNQEKLKEKEKFNMEKRKKREIKNTTKQKKT